MKTAFMCFFIDIIPPDKKILTELFNFELTISKMVRLKFAKSQNLSRKVHLRSQETNDSSCSIIESNYAKS